MSVTKAQKSVVRKNSTGSDFERRRINFIEGSNVTLTVADDPTDNEIDVTIASSGGSGGVSDGDKGDITVSASGATWTIDNDVVTYAKMQNVSATSRILGRSTAGAGDVEELSPATVRTMINVADGATANDTDANLKNRANHTGTQTASTISDFNTAADARITAATGVSVQAYDADLGAIAALSPSNDDVIQRKAGAWTNRTMAQIKTDLSLTKSDVGLGNVDNTSDANKPVSTATQTALDAKAAGAASSTDNAVARYDSTTGKIIQNSGVIIDDNNYVSGWARLQHNSSISDDSANGETRTFTAAENLAFGDVCYMNSAGKMAKADADAASTSAAVTIALGTILADASGTFLLSGEIRDDSAYAFTPGGLIYLSTTAGAVTQTAPSGTDDVVVVLGWAITADEWRFSPSLVQTVVA